MQWEYVSIHGKRQWLIRSIARSEARLQRLQELEAPEIFIEHEKDMLSRRKEDLEKISKEG